MNIVLLGLGSFGYAWTCHLDRQLPNTDTITVWDTREKIVTQLEENRCHPEDTGSTCLASRVQGVTDLEQALSLADIVISAIASPGVIPTLQQGASVLSPEVPFFNTAKGLAPDGAFFSQACSDYLPGGESQYGMIAGATKAHDLQQGHFSLATVAFSSEDIAQPCAQQWQSTSVHFSASSQVQTLEISAVAKNLLTLIYGYLQGKGYSDTEREYAFYSLRSELEQAAPQVLLPALAPSWQVDVMMSAHGGTRNVSFGYEMGQTGQVNTHETVEGWDTLQLLPRNAFFSSLPRLRSCYDFLVAETISEQKWHEIMWQ